MGLFLMLLLLTKKCQTPIKANIRCLCFMKLIIIFGGVRSLLNLGVISINSQNGVSK